LIAEKCDAYLMHGDPPENVEKKIADLRERRANISCFPLRFGVAGYAVVPRDGARGAGRSAAKSRTCNNPPQGNANYQQWLAGRQLEQRVSLEDYSVSNRACGPD